MINEYRLKVQVDGRTFLKQVNIDTLMELDVVECNHANPNYTGILTVEWKNGSEWENSKGIPIDVNLDVNDDVFWFIGDNRGEFQKEKFPLFLRYVNL